MSYFIRVLEIFVSALDSYIYIYMYVREKTMITLYLLSFLNQDDRRRTKTSIFHTHAYMMAVQRPVQNALESLTIQPRYGMLCLRKHFE
jgi:hypothetical protein